MAESVKSANASPPSQPALLSVHGDDGTALGPGCAVRMGHGRVQTEDVGRKKKNNTRNTAHTSKSSDECDIHTDRMLLEMYTYKRPNAHHAY